MTSGTAPTAPLMDTARCELGPPGSLGPASYLPDRRGDTGEHGERNKYGRDPDANRRVICPDGWAAKSGHPDTTPVTDISPAASSPTTPPTTPHRNNSPSCKRSSTTPSRPAAC
jgi:hypothetical protein